MFPFCSVFIDIEPDFKDQLKGLIPDLFQVDNDNFVKEINGSQVTSADLFEYFKVKLLSIRMTSFDFHLAELLCRIRFR